MLRVRQFYLQRFLATSVVVSRDFWLVRARHTTEYPVSQRSKVRNLFIPSLPGLPQCLPHTLLSSSKATGAEARVIYHAVFELRPYLQVRLSAGLYVI